MSLLTRLAVQAAKGFGALSSSNKVSVDYLVVAGGGGGGKVSNSGGGGAGGMLTSIATLSTLNTYSVTVGAGGNGATTNNTSGSQGSNSVISGTGLSTITATGGGYGGHADAAGGNGGSGGGGGYANYAGGTATPGQGNNGGSANSSSPAYSAGGGGGAGAAGGTGTSTLGSGVGGAGLASSISGSSVTYAGGGGGGNDTSTAQAGGSGGGGAGGSDENNAAVAGTTNLGGGGGGSSTLGNGGNGGSGIVIVSYTSVTPKFVGGTITTSGGKQIHTFTSTGSLNPITPITASYLVVAGGGGAVGNRSGGGGAGGLLTSSTTLYSGATYIVTVGAGGAGGAGNAGVTSAQDGSNSVLSGTGLTTITATGGGGGAGTDNPSNGRAGGSGGGAGGDNSTGATGGTGISGQGFAGGTSATNGGGGGGGASAVGSNGASNTGGNGGAGTASSISGTSVTYAGGGGGGANTTAGTGGAGGGGNGAQGSPTTQLAGVSGTQNLGGGAGGGSNWGSTPVTQASGGSGVVIISYAGSQVFNGGLVTSSGGNTIHTFNATGALTPVTNNLNNSLRFRSSASAYLNRTPSIAGNTQKWTWSAWIKLGKLSTFGGLFGALNGTDRMYIAYNSSAKWQIFGTNAGTDYVEAVSTGLYRDPSAWYHIVLAVDTTQATAGNRVKLYVNGTQETVSFTTNMTLNANTSINKAIATVIGESSVGSDPFDGYMTDINFIDGQALEPYYFSNNDAYGNWKPIQYKGTYGTNGFYLNFADTSALTTSSNAGLGKDTSGNGNYWATNNVSITSGVTYDAMLDVPTNTSANVANYAVMNPLWTDGTTVIAQGNLDVSNGNYGGFSTLTIPTNSKFYAEFTVTATQGNQGVGILKATNAYSGVINQSDMFGSNSVTYYSVNGNKFVLGGGSTAYGTSWGTIGDVIGIAVNTVDNQITFYKNNTTQGVITGLTSGIEWVFATGNQTSDGGGAWNFGQRPFSYTPPTGFVALNTYNLSTPTILQGNLYMDASLYTGTGTTQVAVNQGQFKPDLVWLKIRSGAGQHVLTDSVRGVSKQVFSSLTNAETTEAGKGVTSFNSNGFTLGDELLVTGSTNVSAATYVGWQWQAGQGANTVNTSGATSSNVSVSTTAGFSIVTYTGTGANTTIGHGLSAAPKMVIVKNRGSSVAWTAWHTSIANTQYLVLNTTAAAATGATWWNSTTPTSSVISVGTSTSTNASGNTYVAYCWSEIAGFSKFGSYTGNGSADGPFVYLGFRPKFVLVKNSQTGGSWVIHDTSRNTYNVADSTLYPNYSNAEASADAPFDILSNGFKFRGTGVNDSGETHIYMAFAESPFKSSLAR